MANIYLIPTLDSTYRACVSEKPPVSNAVFLVAEGSYPTCLWYIQHNLNMDSILTKVHIRNRETLLSDLNFLGECRNHVAELWSYGAKDTSNDAAHRLFQKCYNRKAVLTQETM